MMEGISRMGFDAEDRKTSEKKGERWGEVSKISNEIRKFITCSYVNYGIAIQIGMLCNYQ